MGRSCLFSRRVVCSCEKGHVPLQDVTLGGLKPEAPSQDSPRGQLLEEIWGTEGCGVGLMVKSCCGSCVLLSGT